jgi:hypothetical protein
MILVWAMPEFGASASLATRVESVTKTAQWINWHGRYGARCQRSFLLLHVYACLCVFI